MATQKTGWIKIVLFAITIIGFGSGLLGMHGKYVVLGRDVEEQKEYKKLKVEPTVQKVALIENELKHFRADLTRIETQQKTNHTDIITAINSLKQ